MLTGFLTGPTSFTVRGKWTGAGSYGAAALCCLRVLALAQCAPLILCQQCHSLINNLDVSDALKVKIGGLYWAELPVPLVSSDWLIDSALLWGRLTTVTRTPSWQLFYSSAAAWRHSGNKIWRLHLHRRGIICYFFYYYLGIVAVLAADIELSSTSSPIRELHSQELSSSGTLGGQQSTLYDLLKKNKTISISFPS